MCLEPFRGHVDALRHVYADVCFFLLSFVCLVINGWVVRRVDSPLKSLGFKLLCACFEKLRTSVELVLTMDDEKLSDKKKV